MTVYSNVRWNWKSIVLIFSLTILIFSPFAKKSRYRLLETTIPVQRYRIIHRWNRPNHSAHFHRIFPSNSYYKYPHVEEILPVHARATFYPCKIGLLMCRNFSFPSQNFLGYGYFSLNGNPTEIKKCVECSANFYKRFIQTLKFFTFTDFAVTIGHVHVAHSSSHRKWV